MSTPFSYFFEKINQNPPLEGNLTERLMPIALKPKMLYFYGKIPENMVKCVSIVGSRKCTKYGEEVAYQLAYDLAKKGVVVISGLAYGIDAAAHRGAVDAGGVTVAVLGTAIDRIYPKANMGLAQRILENNGCIMSEYAAGDEVFTKTSFLARNRLIAGMSDVVVVVEAAARSGALNTAVHALDQGKDLLAVPGDIHRATSVGCNRLIQQGAMPYTGVGDVLSILFPGAPAQQQKLAFGDTTEETEILKLLSEGIEDGEEILQKSGMAVPIFNQTVTMLEIKGQIRSLGANRWRLK